jgi:hypothetical protein
MKCNCGASLNERFSVRREYTSKDDAPSVYGEGHYENNGDYEPDTNTSLADGRFDLSDGSDTCTVCGEVVG